MYYLIWLGAKLVVMLKTTLPTLNGTSFIQSFQLHQNFPFTLPPSVSFLGNTSQLLRVLSSHSLFLCQKYEEHSLLPYKLHFLFPFLPSAEFYNSRRVKAAEVTTELNLRNQCHCHLNSSFQTTFPLLSCTLRGWFHIKGNHDSIRADIFVW